MVVVAADQRTASTGRKREDANARPLAQGTPERPNRYDGPAAEQPAADPPGAKTITIIDGTSGKRQEIVLPAPADAGPPSRRGIEPRMLETRAMARCRRSRRTAPARPTSTPARSRHPRQAESPARRDRDRRARHRRREHERGARQAAAGGRRSRSRPTASDLERLVGRARADRARGAAAGADGAVRLSGQRSGPADAAHLARRRPEHRPPALADEPLPGLCGSSPISWAPASPPPSRRWRRCCARPPSAA